MTPADAYHEALSSHRHYDTMANFALSSIGAAIAGIPALYGVIAGHTGAEAIFLFGILVVHFSIQTYRRFDRYAGIALNVAAAIEKNDPRLSSPPLGFASVFANTAGFPDLDATGLSRTFKRIRVVGYGVCVVFFAVALAIFLGRGFFGSW